MWPKKSYLVLVNGWPLWCLSYTFPATLLLAGSGLAGASENLPPWTVVTEFRATWTVVAANAPPWRVAKLGQLSEFSDSLATKLGQLSEFSDSSQGRVRSNDCSRSRRAEFGNDCSRGQVFASASPARSQRPRLLKKKSAAIYNERTI